MKPATKKNDALIWKLFQAGEAPKDIADPQWRALKKLDPSFAPTLCQVYKGIYRERRRQKVPLVKSRRHRLGTNGNKREKRSRHFGR